MANKKTFVFIAHSREDALFANGMKRALEERGLSVFEDHQVQPGDRWADDVERAILDADLVLLLISPGFLSSPSANFEAGIALGQRSPQRRVVPILLGGITPSALPYPLKQVQSLVAAGLDESEVLKSLEPLLPVVPAAGNV